MRVTNGFPLGCPLSLTGWRCVFRSTTEGMLENLVNLEISHNRIIRLPGTVQHLRRVQRVDLRFNALQTPPPLAGVRCAFSDRNLHSRMSLDPTHVRLKLLHACDQWHSSRASTPLTGWHCKLHPNTEGRCHHCTVLGFEQTLAAPRAIRIHAGVGFVAMRVTPSA